jgi:hypothetical protein
VEEPLLTLEQRRPHLRDALHLGEGQLAPLRVPDHRKEHRGHERHLEQLAPELDPVEGVGEDARPVATITARSTSDIVRVRQTRTP